MAKGKQTDERLKQFFSHNPIEDPLYLKKFLKDHPDQKMAWYLLGREYAAQGKEGKAAYCFAQAGEVYEAFEKRKLNIPQGMKNEEPAAVLPKLRPYVRALTAGVLALVFLLGIPSAEGITGNRQTAESGATSTGGSVEHEGGKEPPAGVAADKPSEAGSDRAPVVYYIPQADKEKSAGEALQRMMMTPGGRESLLVEGKASEDGKWVLWSRPPKPLLLADVTSASGERRVQALAPEVCSCQVGDTAKVTAVLEAWVSQQEERLVLRSALSAYKQKNGKLPDTAEQLARPYPDNLLPGLTPGMSVLFPKIKREMEEGPAGRAASGETGTKNDAPSGGQPARQASPEAFTDPLREPVQIVIDKDAHRLALVSGRHIIRSYIVGLGGDKTPEGEFFISEKVRNPNNKSNGEFGSRGMTLSETLYAIHGTNKPSSIGKDESHGCVRMLKEDIEELYDMVPEGTKVMIGKGLLPPEAGEGKSGPADAQPKRAFHLPLMTVDSNPNKVYKWLD
jgi:lipoprotein-anchoring transpeptidase ErfK/SrfK